MILEFILIFIVALILIKLIIINFEKLGLVDIPNARSMHTTLQPRGAGIGVFLAVAVIDPCFDYVLLSDHILTCLAVISVFVVGMLDDHHDISPNTKLFVLAIAAVMVYFDGIHVDTLGTLFGMEITLGWMALPFTVFAIVGFTNALNLVDGLDGLAGSISIIILGALFSIGYTNDDAYMMVTSGSFIAGLLAFMIYNWNPATIFMGDSGSLILGFVIGLLVIKAATYIQPVTVLFIIAVPLMDTIIVMIRRKRQGKSMFEADKTHLHHVLFNFFHQDVKRTVIFLAILQAGYSITGLLIVEMADQSLSLVLFGLNTIILYFIFTEMLRRQISKDSN